MSLNSVYIKLKSHKYISEFLTMNTLTQLARYLIVGFSTVGLEIINIHILTEYLGIWYIISNGLAYTISFIFNFFLNRFWSFKSNGDIKFQLGAYGILFVFNLFASTAIMYLFTELLSFYYLLSKIISISIIVSWNFILYKKIIYKDRKPDAKKDFVSHI